MENNAHIVAYVLSELSSVGPSRGEVEGKRGGGGDAFSNNGSE